MTKCTETIEDSPVYIYKNKTEYNPLHTVPVYDLYITEQIQRN